MAWELLCFAVGGLLSLISSSCILHQRKYSRINFGIIGTEKESGIIAKNLDFVPSCYSARNLMLEMIINFGTYNIFPSGQWVVFFP